MGQVSTTISSGSLYYGDGSFALTSWREILQQALLPSGANEVISPFGFEVTRDPTYLRRKLRNFYIYLAVGENEPNEHQKSVETYATVLVDIIRERYFDFYKELYQVITPSRKAVIHTDGYRSFYIRYRKTKRGLLREYASYLLTAVGGIYNHQIKAINEFNNDPLSRRYLFQLAIIFTYIFKNDIMGLSNEQKDKLVEHIRLLHTADVLNSDRENSPPSPDELFALTEIVLPYIHDLINFMKRPVAPEDVIDTLLVHDYHGPQDLSVQISTILFNEKVDHIIQSYLMFGEQIR